MSDLRTLIRLHRWQLDEKRRVLADLQGLVDRLGAEAQRLADELAHEAEIARGSATPPLGFANYSRTMRQRQDRLAQSIQQVEQQIATATEEITTAFQELKKYEQVQADRLERSKLRARKTEEATLDEVAITGHRRRAAEPGSD